MPDRTVRLRAVGRQSGFSIGAKYYEPDADGFVVVPDFAAQSVCQYGAFVSAMELPAPTDPADDGPADAPLPNPFDPFASDPVV
jgi:hypothetical protein